jgi:hypothetical protein
MLARDGQMSKRKHIPSEVETQILVNSARRCCLCFGLNNDLSEKRGQIAHLDRDPSNSRLDNLAFLCLAHHDQYDGKTSQSKGLQIEEVKCYRLELYKAVEKLQTSASGQQATVTQKDTGALHILSRIRSGKELVKIAGNAHFYKFDYDEPATEEEAELISGFLEDVVDCCEDLESRSAGAAVHLAFWFNSRIEELEQHGFKVFGGRERQRMNVGGLVDTWDIATLTVIRANNPMIIDVNEVRKLVEQAKAEVSAG